MAKKSRTNSARGGKSANTTETRSTLQKVPDKAKVGPAHAPKTAEEWTLSQNPRLSTTMITQYDDNRRFEPEFPFTGERGDALIALLGPKALNELKVLLRLAAPRADAQDTSASEKMALKEAA